MKVFSTALCFGLLALLSGMNLLQSVHGRPHLISGHELFPAEEVTSHKKLLVPLPNRNPGFQRPSHTGIDLPSRLEEHRQLKKLKGRFKEAKTAQLSSAVQDLSSSHPNKRACFWKYCV